ncbi:MAG: ParA family protein, partial [Gemmatimonadetes bacterium]|nr:ParA family protein [Gemmatimonadota bacterium]
KGRRVLLIDLDPQGNVGQWFGLEREDVRVDAVAIGRTTASEAVVGVRENLDVLASDWRLAEAEEALIRGKERERWLRNRLAKLEDRYDFTIVDCAPSMSILTTSALAYAEEVVIPIPMEYLALIGVRQIVENILRMASSDNGDQIRIAAVVPTFYQSNLRKSGEILTALKGHFKGALTDPIRTNVRLSEAPSHQQTIWEYSPRSRGAEDYRKLVARFA